MKSCLALALLVVVELAACKRNPAHDLGPHARASLVFTNDAARGGSFDTLFETESEVLRSQMLLDHAFEQLPRDTPRDHIAIEAERRGDTSILDVRVAMPDPAVAARVCDALVREYIAYHHMKQHEGAAHQIDALSAELERPHSPADQELLKKRRMDLVILDGAVEADVRGLDRCKAVR